MNSGASFSDFILRLSNLSLDLSFFLAACSTYPRREEFHPSVGCVRLLVLFWDALSVYACVRAASSDSPLFIFFCIFFRDLCCGIIDVRGAPPPLGVVFVFSSLFLLS